MILNKFLVSTLCALIVFVMVCFVPLRATAPPPGPVRYVALLSQSGGNAPIPVVAENSLGDTVVWTRDDVGRYTGTLGGAFTVKTVAFAQIAIDSTAPLQSTIFRQSDDAITLFVFDANGNSVDNFELGSMWITVYP